MTKYLASVCKELINEIMALRQQVGEPHMDCYPNFILGRAIDLHDNRDAVDVLAKDLAGYLKGSPTAYSFTDPIAMAALKKYEVKAKGLPMHIPVILDDDLPIFHDQACAVCHCRKAIFMTMDNVFAPCNICSELYEIRRKPMFAFKWLRRLVP